MRKTSKINARTGALMGLGCLALASLFFLKEAGAIAVFSGGKRSLPIYSVEREDKKISISFDCAWGTEHTDEILSALNKFGVKATFFMVEFWTTKYPDYVKKLFENGMELGTHSKTHSYMSKLTKEQIQSELSSSAQAIEKVTGKKVELFRPPYGDYDDLLIETASAMGLYTIQWSVDSLDWKDYSAETIATRIVTKVQPGSIILCHNNGLHTSETLPIVFQTLQERGYEFVSIGELIYREGNSIDSTGKQLKLKKSV